MFMKNYGALAVLIYIRSQQEVRENDSVQDIEAKHNSTEVV